MKKIFLTVLLYLTYTSINAQITTSINNIFLNSQTTVSNCNTLDFVTTQNNSLVFYYKLTRPQSLPNGTGKLRIMLKYDSSSNPQIITSLDILDSFWANTINEATISGNISENQVQVSGSSIYLEFETSGSIKSSSCSYPITKSLLPTFTLSPTSLNLVCGDTSAKTFAVTPANIPAGANVTYQWNFSGWNGTASSTMSSVSLTPNSGTSLPSTVSVTPFINGVAKPTMSCVVSRATFNPSSVITGNLNLCPSSTSTYTLTNLSSNSVSWNSSNSSVASIGLASGSSVSVNGISNGSVVLTATITNSCGQTATKTFNINIGTANISNHTILGGNNNVSQGSVSLLNVTPAVGATSYIWSVIPMYSGGCSSTLPYILSNGSQTSQIVYWGGCTGMYRVRCLVVNPCGSRYYSDKVVNVFNSIENPCSSARLVVSPNPIKNGNDILLNIIDYPDLPPCDDALFRQISGVKIFNLDSKLVFSNNYDNQKEVRISNLNLDKGYYIIHLTTANKHILKENILIE